ncbi:hypothetical protein RQ094_003886 [Salmonella enterica]|nr:hypothetical protein [Salmonella enterica]EDC7605321.1 hypothetical protein [Salmonella enterica subsp. enterica serovar Newport]ECY2497649.1 hypothetical protein [Salmonella enterica]ECY2524477.1 hypothetical protein [Salmonella enterica]EDN6746598.1 hypothetical protein [Salmonella enterica]
MNYIKILTFCLLITGTGSASAFHVDSMLKVFSEKNNHFILTSEKKEGRDYIFVSLTEMKLKPDGGYQEIPLNPEAVAEWPIIISPGDIVLDSGDEVKVNIIRNSPQPADDRVIGVAFIPDAENRMVNGAALQIALGYKAWLIIPGSAPFKGNVETYRSENSIIINNMTNKILRIGINECQEHEDKICSDEIISLPGSHKKIATSGKELSINIYTLSKPGQLFRKLKL